MYLKKDISIPVWKKYSLNIQEASVYFGIGEKRLYGIIRDNPNADFILEIGTHLRIKRVKFEDFLNTASAL